MGFTRETAIERAKADLAERLGIEAAEVREAGVTDEEFPDGALGAAADGEMSAQMISDGWRIELSAGGETYEYRADPYQLRLCNFEGANHVIEAS